MRSTRAGMSPHVARALEDAGDALKPQIAHCLQCSAELQFGFNPLGQMVERCKNGHARLHRGAPMVTKERRIQESGATKDGEILRQPGRRKP